MEFDIIFTITFLYKEDNWIKAKVLKQSIGYIWYTHIV